jgi:hypothetical protein
VQGLSAFRTGGGKLILGTVKARRCAWCSGPLEGPSVCLPSLGLVLCNGCAVHVGQRLAEEGEDAYLLQVAGMPTREPRHD